jgi:hypothetical protein
MAKGFFSTIQRVETKTTSAIITALYRIYKNIQFPSLRAGE